MTRNQVSAVSPFPSSNWTVPSRVSFAACATTRSYTAAGEASTVPIGLSEHETRYTGTLTRP